MNGTQLNERMVDALKRQGKRFDRSKLMRRFVEWRGTGSSRQSTNSSPPETPFKRPRHFDPENPTEEQLDAIYQNRALVTRVSNNTPTSSSSEPGIVA